MLFLLLLLLLLLFPVHMAAGVVFEAYVGQVATTWWGIAPAQIITSIFIWQSMVSACSCCSSSTWLM